MLTLQQRNSVHSPRPSGAAAAFQRSRCSPRSVDATVARLRTAIESAGLWVLHEIDPQALLSRGGYAIPPTRQVLFFHPLYVARLLAADPAALLEAPLKIAIMECPDGAVTLRWMNPVLALGRYHNAELASLGQELAVICESIAAEATARQP